jgi:hypothetical protein
LLLYTQIEDWRRHGADVEINNRKVGGNLICVSLIAGWRSRTHMEALFLELVVYILQVLKGQSSDE